MAAHQPPRAILELHGGHFPAGQLCSRDRLHLPVTPPSPSCGGPETGFGCRTGWSLPWPDVACFRTSGRPHWEGKVAHAVLCWLSPVVMTSDQERAGSRAGLGLASMGRQNSWGGAVVAVSSGDSGVTVQGQLLEEPGLRVLAFTEQNVLSGAWPVGLGPGVSMGLPCTVVRTVYKPRESCRRVSDKSTLLRSRLCPDVSGSSTSSRSAS